MIEGKLPLVAVSRCGSSSSAILWALISTPCRPTSGSHQVGPPLRVILAAWDFAVSSQSGDLHLIAQVARRGAKAATSGVEGRDERCTRPRPTGTNGRCRRLTGTIRAVYKSTDKLVTSGKAVCTVEQRGSVSTIGTWFRPVRCPRACTLVVRG